ncbi:nucleotidyltransferase domain-containing protein [Methanothermobacter sp. K4]|uniref:type VII toxin-antitoxin system MntA family adenylyltransferase antitoxin n=1 Tax=Methanothermobacter sp. K4 TaxID=2913262 RepID=UPI001EDB808E|nr:nucleotidyltransferase domain-containing protein [Methanothermobacter sp. K4]
MMDIENQKMEKLVEILGKRDEVSIAYLFGSTARGDKGTLGDFDIGVLLKETLKGYDELSFQLELIDELVSALRTDRVDLVIMNRAPLSLNYNIIRDGIVLKDSEEERVRFEGRVMSEYLDRRYHNDRHTRLALRMMAREGLK